MAIMAHNLRRSSSDHNLALVGLRLSMFYQKYSQSLSFGAPNMAQSDIDMPSALEENFCFLANSLIIHNTAYRLVIG